MSRFSATAPRKSLRKRLALLYGGLYLASGAALLAFVDAGLLSTSSTKTVVEVGSVPSGGAPAPAVHHGVDQHQLLLYSALVLVAMIAAAFPLGWLTAGRVLQPFRTIVATARVISASSLHERLRLPGPYDEFRELGETLDDLLARLEASFESQRRFVANASHELRTPLTAERALLQVTLADPVATVETFRSACEELLMLGDQQARLVEALLTLASSERGVESWDPFDLGEIVATAVGQRREEADRRGIRVDAAYASAPAAGDVRLVESLVANLVDNALYHNVAGGRVEISTGIADGRAVLSISNTGPVIAVDEVDRLFEPFQRLGNQRIHQDGGHGLGLAIVHAIAKAHGAEIARSPGDEGGLRIEVTFVRAGSVPDLASTTAVARR
jgi:signal transduction histidine kinase